MSPKREDSCEDGSLIERVTRIEAERDAEKEQRDEDRRLLREVHQSIVGEGSAPGLKGRIDRLETRQKVLAGVGGALLAVVSAVAALLGIRH